MTNETTYKKGNNCFHIHRFIDSSYITIHGLFLRETI